MTERANNTTTHNKEIMERWHLHELLSNALIIFFIVYNIIVGITLFSTYIVLNHPIPSLLTCGMLGTLSLAILIFIFEVDQRKLILKYDFSNSDTDILNVEEINDFKYTRLDTKPHLFINLQHYQKVVFPNYEPISAMVEREVNKQIFKEEMLIFRRNKSASTLKLYKFDCFKGDTKTLLSINDEEESSGRVWFGVLE